MMASVRTCCWRSAIVFGREGSLLAAVFGETELGVAMVANEMDGDVCWDDLQKEEAAGKGRMWGGKCKEDEGKRRPF